MENSKTIFVKITGQFSETSVNDGVIIKISRASAEKLGITGKTFKVNLLYGVSK